MTTQMLFKQIKSYGYIDRTIAIDDFRIYTSLFSQDVCPVALFKSFA